MKRFFAAFGFFAALLTMVSCEKDTNPNFIRASISNYHGPDKVYIGADNYACWDGSEHIWINGVNTYTLTTIVGDNSRFLIDMGDNQPEAGDILYALFQSDDMELGTFNTTTATIPVTLPREQIYAEDQQGRQVINAPMVAQATVNAQGGADLKFHNVCSLLKIQLRHNVFVHDITVTSSAAPLAGSGTVTFSETNPTLVMNSTAAEPEDKVVKLTVNKSRSDGVFYIVLPPYSTASKLTVEVYDDPQVRMKLQQQNTHTLGASEIATIDVGSGDLGRGIFSVDRDRSVSFAKGNLTSSGTNLSFENDQTAIGSRYSSRPSITGQMAQEWFYLSDDEWNYLLNRGKRDGSTHITDGHNYAIRGTVGSTMGLILLPDTWYDYLESIAEAQEQFDGTSPNMSSLSVQEWKVCEELGAVFLPSYQQSHNEYYTGSGHYLNFGQNGGPHTPASVQSSSHGDDACVRLAHFVVGSPTVTN